MLFVLVLSGLAGVLSAGCSRGDDASVASVASVVELRVAQVRAAAAEAGLADDVTDVVAAAAGAPAATFSAVFVGGGVEGSVVVHQRPPRRRVDVVDGSGRTVTSFVVDGAGSAQRCLRGSAGRWRCSPVGGEEAVPPVGAFSPAALDAAISALAEAGADAGAGAVSVERTRVAGAPVACVVSGPADRLCVSRSGVPLLVERSDGTPPLRATAYRTSVDDADLRAPR